VHRLLTTKLDNDSSKTGLCEIKNKQKKKLTEKRTAMCVNLNNAIDWTENAVKSTKYFFYYLP